MVAFIEFFFFFAIVRQRRKKTMDVFLYLFSFVEGFAIIPFCQTADFGLLVVSSLSTCSSTPVPQLYAFLFCLFVCFTFLSIPRFLVFFTLFFFPPDLLNVNIASFKPATTADMGSFWKIVCLGPFFDSFLGVGLDSFSAIPPCPVHALSPCRHRSLLAITHSIFSSSTTTTTSTPTTSTTTPQEQAPGSSLPLTTPILIQIFMRVVVPFLGSSNTTYYHIYTSTRTSTSTHTHTRSYINITWISIGFINTGRYLPIPILIPLPSIFSSLKNLNSYSFRDVMIPV